MSRFFSLSGCSDESACVLFGRKGDFDLSGLEDEVERIEEFPRLQRGESRWLSHPDNWPNRAGIEKKEEGGYGRDGSCTKNRRNFGVVNGAAATASAAAAVLVATDSATASTPNPIAAATAAADTAEIATVVEAAAAIEHTATKF